MASKTKLKEKLENAEAFQSLKLEGQIKSCLEKYHWYCIHSPYYLDSLTEKFRELDIVAKRRFSEDYQFSSGENSPLFTELSLFVEAKTISGYHLIFDGKYTPSSTDYFMFRKRIWVGADTYNHFQKTYNILNQLDLSKNKTIEIVNHIEKKCFDKSDGENEGVLSIFSDSYLEPFNQIDFFTAFRETKINTTKDLSNSVVWKSFQSLNAALTAYEHSYWNRFQSDLMIKLDWAKRLEDFSIASLMHDNELGDYEIREQLYLHPILVIDAHLWKVANNELSEIKYCRLLQRSVRGNLDNWIDIVRYEHLDSYIQSLTNHYNEQCSHLTTINDHLNRIF